MGFPSPAASMLSTGWNTAEPAVANGVGRQHLTRKFFAKLVVHNVWFTPCPPRVSAFVGGWAQVKNIMRVNTMERLIHIFAWSFDMELQRERERKRKKQTKYRSNGVVPTLSNLSRVLGSTLFILSFFLSFFFRLPIGITADRKGRSISNRFERKNSRNSKEIGDKSEQSLAESVN